MLAVNQPELSDVVVDCVGVREQLEAADCDAPVGVAVARALRTTGWVRGEGLRG